MVGFNMLKLNKEYIKKMRLVKFCFLLFLGGG